jgi:glyoxylase-like metal-dependent hydrolase (beta-lactamase superfamily II)
MDGTPLLTKFFFAPRVDRPLRGGVSGVAIALVLAGAGVASGCSEVNAGQAGAAYKDMPSVVPIGVRPDRYLPIPQDALAPEVEPAKGYRLQLLGRGLYMVTDNAYQSLFMVYETGVIVVDAPPNYSANLRRAVAEVTDLPITHVIYSHSHLDHIGGVTDLGGRPVLVAHEQTKRLLLRANDPRRPVPTVTFEDQHTLKLGSQVLELSYHGEGHGHGNIFIYAPEQKVLMAVDLVFPGWMPWRRFALATDVDGYFRQVAEIDRVPFTTFVGGHVSRVGTHADVRLQLEFMTDLKAAAADSLKSTPFGEELAPEDKSNPWAGADNYIDRVAAKCVKTLTPKWKSRLAGYDVWIWDQCYAMEQSLRID